MVQTQGLWYLQLASMMIFLHGQQSIAFDRSSRVGPVYMLTGLNTPTLHVYHVYIGLELGWHISIYVAY
ncbi:hypothetical protein DAI22_01g460600 [Oryza sativa Japonica Group]|nr:hypothetical protein DAI22_01g460600 [Oryza sativa Japonica Group]